MIDEYMKGATDDDHAEYVLPQSIEGKRITCKQS